jgi:hypothetical protein
MIGTETLPQLDQQTSYHGQDEELAMDSNSKPVDRPSQETVEVRQGTGPRATVSVLFISLILAAIAGIGMVAYVMTTQ